MANTNETEPTNTNSGGTTSTSTTYTATPFQIGLGLMLVGASAGLTLYTKKTQSMLTQLKRVDKNRQMRQPKKKYGPPTQQQWEKMRPRWSDDDAL
mmetsp:Transcript_27576/g.26436  ORF Transcript_27576/g.26436 Transcript_27576/m.26436 type:complete len:96 (+) Transcript_27576:196-483(+)|eukprot:CAMPEP_0197824474 /NCGR_PEP_ID=MMETSP1437-20131217/1702_1 /TAXON_ID=49252 ORGANISM="Eucampia antarctica, Strain CCMP1452" /NCGR_SAMPLE_ID=MMETSP1437 /ASSEMBLY_ACC=CAM_ASM_001096 /LENGTH=95 /DNA_ID=CAMNT_0043424101 /DNA_START=161 /DNA_END=448 /DNA_ORIENTATION=+